MQTGSQCGDFSSQVMSFEDFNDSSFGNDAGKTPIVFHQLDSPRTGLQKKLQLVFTFFHGHFLPGTRITIADCWLTHSSVAGAAAVPGASMPGAAGAG